MITTLAYTCLMLAYFAILYMAPALEPGPNDRPIEGEETFLKLVTILNIVWLISFALPFFVPPLELLDPVYAAIAGGIVFGICWWIRATAIRTLGNFFTYKLTIRPEHRVIKEGLYRYIRHPSYTGTLLQVIGMMIAGRSWAGMLGYLLSGGVVIAIRIYREERLLCQVFGEEYETYMKSTWRLIPWIY